LHWGRVRVFPCHLFYKSHRTSVLCNMTVPIAAASPTDNGSFNVPNPAVAWNYSHYSLWLYLWQKFMVHWTLFLLQIGSSRSNYDTETAILVALCVCVCVLVLLQLHFGIMLVSHIPSPPPVILDSQIIV
jgi:hypothetical protein